MPYLPNGTYLPATDEEYYATLPEDPLHTPTRPFCYDDTCPDREDQDAINELEQARQDGLVSDEDVDLIYHGKTV